MNECIGLGKQNMECLFILGFIVNLEGCIKGNSTKGYAEWGNLLLNIGPDGNGNVPLASKEILLKAAAERKKN
jgi:hypothetical protein